jgi:fatty acid desaturase
MLVEPDQGEVERMGCWFVGFVLIFWIIGILTAPEMLRIYGYIVLFVVGAVLLWAAFCIVFFRLRDERRKRREREEEERRLK